MEDFEKKVLREMLGIGENLVEVSTTSFKKPVPDMNLRSFTGEPLESEWPDPERIVVKLPKVQPMKPEMLPIALKLWLVDMSERMCCPLDYVAVAAIISAGSIIGARCAILPKQQDSWLVVSNLWGMIIGEPSQMKTPSTTEVLKLFTSLEKAAKEKFSSENTEYKVDHEIQKAHAEELKKTLRKPDTDKSQIKKELLELEKRGECNKPRLKRYKVGDTTAEKVAELSAENPDGFLIFRDELMGLLKSLEKQGCEPHRAFYLESWSGTSPYTVDRVVKGSFFIERLCLSLFGGTQPDKIKTYLHEMAAGGNDGLLQRFQLMVYPDPIRMEYIDRRPNREARDSAYGVFKRLAEIGSFESFGATCEIQDDIPAFRFTDDAQSLFAEWWKDHHDVLSDDDLSPYLKEHFSKYRSLMPSLALIFHLVNEVSKPNPIPGRIKKESVALAIMWCDYLITHAKRIYNGLGHSNRHSAVELSKKISSGKIPDEFSIRDVQQKCWHLLDTKETIKTAVLELIESGWLAELPVSETSLGRPPAPRFLVNPKARNFYSKL
jgi:hypothetical protein